MGERAPDVVSASETLNGPYITSICKIASLYSIWISVGGFPEKCVPDPTKVYNTHLLITPAGNIAYPVYRKIHLFDCPMVGLYESKVTASGDSTAVIDIGFASVGLSVCYDLRFPELYSALTNPMLYQSKQSSIDGKKKQNIEEKSVTTASVDNPKEWSYNSHKGADIILIPAAFTVPTGTAHWLTLLRARSIENQTYIIAAAQSGRHNERRESYGHSIIIDPWGSVISECSINNTRKEQNMSPNTNTNPTSTNLPAPQSTLNDETVVTADGEICYAIFNLSTLNSIREKIPIQSHKRFKIIFD